MNKMVNPAFCADILARQSQNRQNNEILNQALQNVETKFFLFSDNFPFLIKNDKEIIVKTFNCHEINIENISNAAPVYAGISENCHVFLINVKEDSKNYFCEKYSGEFINLRSILMQPKIDQLEILGLGASLFGWHKNHQFCVKCGNKTKLKDMGFSSFCEKCETEHYPRIDPVVIMLVLKDDKCLFGRSKEFPENLYSILAGFVEPCETIEQACRREVLEETNIEIGDVKIIGNQPWPFISQLMIGLEAQALSDKITINENELEDAIWLSKPQVRQLLSKDGLELNGRQIFGPRKIAIANSLVNYWLDNNKD